MMTIEQYIERGYSHWLNTANMLARIYGVDGWGEDALNDVLLNVLTRHRLDKIIQDGGDVELHIRQFISASVSNRLKKQYKYFVNYVEIDNRLCYLQYDNETNEEATDMWKTRRAVEAKFRDDSYEPYSPTSIEELPLAPDGCSLYQNKILHKGKGNSSPRVQVSYVVSLYNRSLKRRIKAKAFSSRTKAVSYLIAVKEKYQTAKLTTY